MSRVPSRRMGLLERNLALFPGWQLGRQPQRTRIERQDFLENMLARGWHLTGVLDWEDAGVGDPAVDLAGLWYLGDDWAHQVVRALDAPEPLLRRVACWRVARELRGAAWAARHRNPSELAESAAKVSSLASALRGSLAPTHAAGPWPGADRHSGDRRA